MNVIIKLVLLFCYRASAIELLKRKGDFNAVENESELGPGTVRPGHGNQMNSTVHMSVNHYHCAVDDVEDAVMILYGTKSWTFPAQDVNLTLSYPSANSESPFSSEDDGYLITSFKVILYIDAIETKGYIMEGGVLQDSIVLAFVSRNITSLSYQFWLYGKPKHSVGFLTDLNKNYFVCS